MLPAAAERPLGVEDDVADLAGAVARPVDEDAVRYEGRADPGPDADVDEVVHPAAGPEAGLGQTARPVPVEHRDGKAELRFQALPDRDSLPAEVVGPEDGAGFAVHEAGGAHAQGREEPVRRSLDHEAKAA